MSEKSEDIKLKIPFGIGYSKLIKLMRLILQKDGDTKTVSIDSITSSSTIPPNFVLSNLAFLKSINILEMNDTKNCKLTSNGTKFIRALSLDNKKDIKETAELLIKNSPLKDIQDLIKTEGSDLKLEKIYRLIKTNAKISDGNRSGNMSANSATGANALLKLLEKCEILPSGILLSQQPTVSKESSKPAPQKSTNSKRKKSSSKITSPPSTSSEEFYSLKSDIFYVGIKKSINIDDYNSAKEHIDLFLKSLKNKINSNSG